MDSSRRSEQGEMETPWDNENDSVLSEDQDVPDGIHHQADKSHNSGADEPATFFHEGGAYQGTIHFLRILMLSHGMKNREMREIIMKNQMKNTFMSLMSEMMRKMTMMVISSHSMNH